VHLLKLRLVIVIPREQCALEPDARDVVARVEPNAGFEDTPLLIKRRWREAAQINGPAGNATKRVGQPHFDTDIKRR
jgi:hypothetical protein